MSAKSIREFDGKALLAYFLPRSPIFGVPCTAEYPQLAPKLAQLRFSPDASESEIKEVFDKAQACYPWLTESGARFVCKPDMLIKRRGKSGLLGLNKTWEEVKQWVGERAGKTQQVEHVEGKLTVFLVEPFVKHDQKSEYYININSSREGDNILFYHEGGVDVGDVDAKASKLLVPIDLSKFPSDEDITSQLFQHVPEGQRSALLNFVKRLYAVYVDLQFTYMEINPLVVLETANGIEFHALDLAGKVDQTAEFECGPKWSIARSDEQLGKALKDESAVVTVDNGPPMEFPSPFGRDLTPEESYIADIDAKTGASLKLTVLNPKGSIWTLVAGGGASVVYADAIASAGYADDLANYGEYSGAPNEAQTYAYAKTVLNLMVRGDVYPNGKVLFIGGGIANFTSVGSTFKGIIRAFRDTKDEILKHKIRIYVRRGGPSWQEGLRLLTDAGNELKLPMEIYGPEMHVSGIVPLALSGKKFDIKPFGVTPSA